MTKVSQVEALNYATGFLGVSTVMSEPPRTLADTTTVHRWAPPSGFRPTAVRVLVKHSTDATACVKVNLNADPTVGVVGVTATPGTNGNGDWIDGDWITIDPSVEVVTLRAIASVASTIVFVSWRL